MQKPVFVLNFEGAIIIAKINLAKVYDVSCIHRQVSSLRLDTCARLGVVPKGGIRTSIMWSN
jgi:hypothetical protein